jgi:hypothetical protein
MVVVVLHVVEVCLLFALSALCVVALLAPLIG